MTATDYNEEGFKCLPAQTLFNTKSQEGHLQNRWQSHTRHLWSLFLVAFSHLFHWIPWSLDINSNREKLLISNEWNLICLSGNTLISWNNVLYIDTLSYFCRYTIDRWSMILKQQYACIQHWVDWVFSCTSILWNILPLYSPLWLTEFQEKIQPLG